MSLIVLGQLRSGYFQVCLLCGNVATEDAVIGLTHGILVIFGQSIQGRPRIVEVGESDPDNLVFVLKNLVHQVSEVISILFGEINRPFIFGQESL